MEYTKADGRLTLKAILNSKSDLAKMWLHEKKNILF